MLNGLKDRTTISFFVEKSGGIFLSFTSFFVITRVLPVDSLAIYAAILSLYGIMLAFSNFGMSGLLLKVISEKKDKNSVVIESFKLRLIGSIFITIVFFLVLYVSENVLFYYFLFGALILPLKSFEVIDQKLIYEREVNKIAINTILVSIIFLFLRCLGFFIEVGPEFYIFLFSIQSAISKIYLYKDIKFKLSIDLSLFKEIISRSYKIYIGSTIGSFFTRLPVLILFYMNENIMAAGFFVILQIIEFSTLFASSISANYFTKLLKSNNKNITNEYKYLIVFIGALLTLIVFLTSSILVNIFNIQIDDASFLIKLLSIMVLFYFLREYYSKIIILLEMQSLSISSNGLKLFTFICLMMLTSTDLSIKIAFSLLIALAIEIIYIHIKTKPFLICLLNENQIKNKKNY